MNYYSRCKESSVIDIKNLPRIRFSGDSKGSMMVLDRRHVRTEKPRPTVLIVSSHGSYLAPTINHKYRLKYKIKVKKIIYIYISRNLL